jgi:hypothetical protein
VSVTPADHQELLRLTSLLQSLDDRQNVDREVREALKKAALALNVAFIHGLRAEVERMFAGLEKPLGPAEREHLRRLGIDPDA